MTKMRVLENKQEKEKHIWKGHKEFSHSLWDWVEPASSRLCCWSHPGRHDAKSAKFEFFPKTCS